MVPNIQSNILRLKAKIPHLKSSHTKTAAGCKLHILSHPDQSTPALLIGKARRSTALTWRLLIQVISMTQLQSLQSCMSHWSVTDGRILRHDEVIFCRLRADDKYIAGINIFCYRKAIMLRIGSFKPAPLCSGVGSAKSVVRPHPVHRSSPQKHLVHQLKTSSQNVFESVPRTTRWDKHVRRGRVSG